MTLCLVWKQNSKYYFSSDSRLSNNGSVITDNASKIFKIEVKIYGPSKSEDKTNKNELLQNASCGLCFTGSYLNGSLLADTMNQVLSKLQGAPKFSDFSIENISNISLGVYKQISTQLMKTHRQNGLYEALFGGFCIVSGEFKLFKFGFRINGEISFYKEEIDLKDLPISIGDKKAKKKAELLFKKVNSKYSYFHLIREIIKDKNISSVGGDIQNGIFEDNKFDTFGIIEYNILREENKLVRVDSSF